MRVLTLQPTRQSPGERGGSLTSNFVPPNLENKFLVPTSSLLMPSPGSSHVTALRPSSCPSLQPSSLSSTSSTLLLTSSLSSPLTSTQNKLLHGCSPTALAFSSSPLVPSSSLLSSSRGGGALLNRFSRPPSFSDEDGKQEQDDGGAEGREEVSEAKQRRFEEASVQYSDEADMSVEEENEVEKDADSTMELPVVDAMNNQENDQTLVPAWEDFAEIDREKEKIEKDTREKKYFLLNAVCCSLVNKCAAPGQKGWDSETSAWTRIIKLANDISVRDPQFLLKVAVYTRQELNIRITANFLLALAASQPLSKVHVRRYFCAAVQLPSDWLEVVRIYSTCFSRSLPSCLKKAMVDKFKQFSEYQLAKYNTRRHRCKHNRNRPKGRSPSEQQLELWANLVRSDAAMLRKYLQVESREVVDKKQSEFSMKKMIKRLHIKEPAEHVMAILGKKYPADLKAFTCSGMKGDWDRERAGQRMKLKEPETWERLVSLEGNKAATWEKLIDNKSLPFMALLRNLRNMISQGISEAHHRKILSRLTNKKAVIQSRQFPLRFLAAYKVIMELYSSATQEAQEEPDTNVRILKGILKKIPKSQRYRSLDWETAKRRRMRMALGVPFVYRMYLMKKAQLLKASQRQYTADLLNRYREALETAFQISCCYNIPPLPGRTLILLNSYLSCSRTQSKDLDFCLPPDPEGKEEGEEEEDGRRGSKKNKDDKLNPSVMEKAVLLALMIKSSAEDCQIHLVSWDGFAQIKLKSDVLLENIRSVIKQIDEFRHTTVESSCSGMLTKKDKVDNIITLNEDWVLNDIEWAINNYRAETHNALVMNISLSDRESQASQDSNCVNVTGFSEQILRFVAERGSSRLLDHVEHLDKLYNIPPPEGAKDPQTTTSVSSIPASPKLRWRGVRVFISSTFRDMHAERDILVRSIFPELRRRAASHCLHLQEVELRWGVTEEESGRAVELCLSEVCRSQMLVAILGERYGLVPPRPVLPDLPQYSWLAAAPGGLSVTEMEIRQFEALHPDTAPQRMFCYFRDPNIIKSVPAAWRSDFAPESKEAEAKMASLKRRLWASKVKVTENYPCVWGGVVEGKPYLKSLEGFSKAVLEDLWMAVVKQFVKEGDEGDAALHVDEQEVHQGALQRQFFGRAKLLSAAVEMVEQIQTKGGMMVVEGAPGQGKTVFMAALADALRTGVQSRKHLVCDVISYSTAASHSARSVENLLRCLVQWLRRMKNTEEEATPPLSYKDLLSEFHSTLRDRKTKKPLVLLVDGVDLVRDGRGQLSSEWILHQLPQGVCIVLSIASKSALLQTLAKRKETLLFAVGQLTLADRKEIVQKGLDAIGKKLSNSAFNNQLQTLLMKKGADSPLYLRLACDDLRTFASFDKLTEILQGLPPSLSQLVQYSLERLCSQYRGMLGLRGALAALTVSAAGLRERDLYCILSTCNDLSLGDEQVTWQEVLHLSRKPKGCIPMAVFTQIVQSLQSLMSPSHCRATDDLLALTNPVVKQAFEDFLLPTHGDRSRAHLVLAAHLWALADAQGSDTFLHCEASSVQHLSSSLIQSDRLDALHSLLSNYYFLYANVRHSLLHHLLETYSGFDNKHKSAPSSESLEDCRSFLLRHAPLLSSWPALFIQQALNEPPETRAHIWAQGLVGKGHVRVIKWLNNNNQTVKESSKLVSTFQSKPRCLVLSSDGELMVVGTGGGTLHCINTQTGLEVKSLVSSCDGISSCLSLKDGSLAITSFDGQIEIWNTENGCRTAVIKGHTNVITASAISASKKHMATVSLDLTLKVWTAGGQEVGALDTTSPLNCVTFDHEDRLLAAGCWNGRVMVWDWFKTKTQAVLSGHQQSVRSLSFSPSSSMLCSGSISGEVRVWSVPTSTCLGCFQAHHGATEALTFLDEGSKLLTAGSDHTLQLWSGGLGRSVAALKSDEGEQEPPQKRTRSETSELAALCAAVNGDYVAVGYQENFKIFSLSSGEMIWTPDVLNVSVRCLLWLVVGSDEKSPELLVTGGGIEKRLRMWKSKGGDQGLLGGMEMVGVFAAQAAVILALAQNSTHLATAADDGTIALWPLIDLAQDTGIEPDSFLRGHNGAVTCLAFSPDGGELLSGGKDQALMVWDVSSSPAVPSKSLPHSHRDWITSCAWTPDCVVSSSNDGRLCFWDLKSGRSVREIPWTSPLTSVCCLGQYVMAGCAEGGLHVWKWETKMEICHISAHQQRIHHCSVLVDADKNKEVNPEEMTAVTTSDDGTARLWKPLQMEHFGTFQGHSGAVHGVVRKEGVPEFFTVSEDSSLRCWSWATECPPSLRGCVTALCFTQTDGLVLAGYESGLLELWQHSAVVGHKQASDSSIAAICSMPDGQVAVSYMKPCVDVWKLVWNQQRSAASLVKVTTHRLPQAIVHLSYCTVLLGVADTASLVSITSCDQSNRLNNLNHSWNQNVRILGSTRNDEKSMWLLGEREKKIEIGFIFAMGPENELHSAFSSITLKMDEEAEGGELPTAASLDKEFVVCGDMMGNMWYNQPPAISSWSIRKPAHRGRISALRLTSSTIISASLDRTVKLWDRNTKKQVGMFVCDGPVLMLEVNPEDPSELVCGDGRGKLYFLSLKEQSS
ncbi:telomerase protein component 1 [Aulostomus maculatus]